MPELYKDVTEGWNLIGPKPSEATTEQSIGEIEEELSKIKIPMEIIDGTIWKVNSKDEYEQVTSSLQPGRGYWVKLRKKND
jgi:hypothetical protein